MILICIGIFLMMSAVVVMRNRQSSEHIEQHVAEASQLYDVDPLTQEKAARNVLAFDHRHVEARLALAEALLMLGRYDAVRLELEPVLHDCEQSKHISALTLAIDSCLLEAQELIRHVRPPSIDIVAQHVQTLAIDISRKIDSIGKTARRSHRRAELSGRP